jgi:glycosyltransferase involved in cell wall biosynthesis
VPNVSIVIPTYQGARHIRPAIESVLAQEGVDLEIVVTDDNSRDGTADIVASYGDPRVRLIRNPANLGPEGNWNRALELATGTYVKLLPQDDLLLPGSLAAQVAVLDADRTQEIALVFGAREVIGPSGRIITRRGLKGAIPGRIRATTLRRDCVRRGTNLIGEPGAVLFRRALAEKVGGFDGQQGYVIDLDYWFRLLAHGDGWYMAEPVSAFRVSGGSWSVAIGTDQARQYTAFLARMRATGLIAPSMGDMAMGRANALLNNLLRLVFYKLVVR